jgi:Xaa-Pro aminopeptidase
MVLTVEPGLYIPANREGIENRWHGIGVRIEDDIQVTTEGHYNLSHDLVVEIDDLEALIRG